MMDFVFIGKIYLGIPLEGENLLNFFTQFPESDRYSMMIFKEKP